MLAQRALSHTTRRYESGPSCRTVVRVRVPPHFGHFALVFALASYFGRLRRPGSWSVLAVRDWSGRDARCEPPFCPYRMRRETLFLLLYVGGSSGNRVSPLLNSNLKSRSCTDSTPPLER
jgi:hypothetical protein